MQVHAFGQRSWLQIQRSGFDSRSYQVFWEVVGLERGSISLVSTLEELLGRKSSGSGLESENTAIRIHHAEHVAPSTLKSWHQLRRQVAVAWSAQFAYTVRPRSYVYVLNYFASIKGNSISKFRCWFISLELEGFSDSTAVLQSGIQTSQSTRIVTAGSAIINQHFLPFVYGGRKTPRHDCLKIQRFM
jgi:hypothetical protein